MSRAALLPLRRLLRAAQQRAVAALSPAPRHRGAAPGVLDCRIAYNVHGAYCVPLSSAHRPAARAILAGRVWEPQTIALLLRHCGAGDVVQAGTYFGDFLPALARACAPHRTVWAFEPNPENHRCAQITIALNQLGNVRLANAALGARRAQLPLRIEERSGRALGGGSRLRAAGAGPEAGEVAVEVVALDDSLPADCQVAALQLDVEGHEQAALAGALAILRRCRPLILVETPPAPEWQRAHLEPLGYRLVGQVHANSIYSAR